MTEDLLRFVIYRCIVGSTAYGLSDEHSDTDRRGFYLPPAHLHWSLTGVPEQLDSTMLSKKLRCPSIQTTHAQTTS